MSSNLPEESVIREYLLGTLPEQDWDAIEEKLLSDKEFADFVDSIEDEIIEEYLTIHNHFLRPRERQRKLLFASVLRSKLQKKQQVPVPVDFSRRLPTARTARPYWAAVIGAAAVLLLSTALLAVYTAGLHRNLEVAKTRTNNAESMLAQIKTQMSSLQNEPRPGENSVDIAAELRDTGDSYRHPFTSDTTSLRVRLPVDEPISPPYSVELRFRDPAGKALWWQDNLQPEARTLVFVIPYSGPGQYYLNVFRRGNPASASGKKYQFATEQAHDPALKH
ncbi:MAG TPA: hypothetical protein VG649_21975 [Candidatus Angelobacter sp.]|nr:hypothetical protein [Candidatus Angelobacter sp.]